MSQFVEPKRETAEKLSAKKESAGLIPELPMFAYSVERIESCSGSTNRKRNSFIT
jgi:hypothetical protein